MKTNVDEKINVGDTVSVQDYLNTTGVKNYIGTVVEFDPYEFDPPAALVEFNHDGKVFRKHIYETQLIQMINKNRKNNIRVNLSTSKNVSVNFVENTYEINTSLTPKELKEFSYKLLQKASNLENKNAPIKRTFSEFISERIKKWSKGKNYFKIKQSYGGNGHTHVYVDWNKNEITFELDNRSIYMTNEVKRIVKELISDFELNSDFDREGGIKLCILGKRVEGLKFTIKHDGDKWITKSS